MADPDPTAELEAAERRAHAELALMTAQAEAASRALADIRALCATHEAIPGSPYSALINDIAARAAAGLEPQQ